MRPVGWLRRCLLGGLARLADAYRRLWFAFLAIVGPRAAYALSAGGARLLYRLLPPVRQRSEAQCGAALGRHLSVADVPRVAAASFVHRVWNLVDLALADRLLHPGTYRRYGGEVPPVALGELLDAQRRGQAAILLTAYYGPFDLLPVFVGFGGVRAATVYLPHANAAFDAYRARIRSRGGSELVPVREAMSRVTQVLAGGGTVALVADHAARRGVAAEFLGLPTVVPRTVGLLAERYGADVVVAGIRRVGPFRFRIEVIDVIRHVHWSGRTDAVEYVTRRYLRGIEQLIMGDPSQYLWAHGRWGIEG